MLEDRIEDHFLSINQPYLAKMYKPIISTGYHGLLRAGELMAGPHVIKACNVHTGVNKKKIQIILASSKTHSESMAPQSITIISDEDYNDKYCLYNIFNDYISVRRKCILDNEPFFIFRDGSHVRQNHMRAILRKTLMSLGLDHQLYNLHSLRIGRITDLSKSGTPVEQIKILGRWKSDSVYRYIRKNPYILPKQLKF